MKTTLAVTAIVAVSLLAPELHAQEADTIRVDDGRITIIIEDGSVHVQEGRRATARAPREVRREVRVERGESPRSIWMTRRDEAGADTLVLDFDRIARFAERAATDLPLRFERWLEDFDPPAALGGMSEDRRQVMRMEMEARDMARRIRSAEGAERDDLEHELRAHLDELFSLRLELQRERVDRLQERLEEEQADLETRRHRRGEIVERRFRELVGERDVLEW